MAAYIPGASESIPQLPLDGLTGEYLRKKSDADYDTEWAPVIGGSGAVARLDDIGDVEASLPVDGSVLVYNASTSRFVAGSLDTRITLTDGGAF